MIAAPSTDIMPTIFTVCRTHSGEKYAMNCFIAPLKAPNPALCQILQTRHLLRVNIEFENLEYAYAEVYQ